MAIYNGTQKVKPSGIAKVYVGSQLVYQSVQPTPYRRLDYIQSVYGESMGINLNYLPNDNIKFYLDFLYTDMSYSGWGRIYGCRGNTSGDSYAKIFGFFINKSSRNASPNWGSFDPGNSSGINITQNTRYVITVDKGKFYLNGTLMPNASTSNSIGATASRPIGLFCGFEANKGNPGLESSGVDMKAYRCKLWDNNVLVRNLVPVQRKSDNVCGLYDIENNVFYTSVTSTGFVAGNTVEENWNYTDPDTPYRRLDYISSSGTKGGQYTNTGIRPTLNTKMEIKAACINTGTRHDGPLCGARHPNGQFIIWFNDNDGVPKLRPTNGNNNLPTLTIPYGKAATVILDKNGAYINGTYYSGSTSTMSIENYILIYTMMQDPRGSVDSRRFTGYVYYCKLWESNSIVRNLIPAQRKSDNVVGLYDIVNDVFYTSLSGTGFVAGPTAEENWNYTDPNA